MPTTWRVAKGILDSSNRDSLFTGFATPATIGQKYEFKWPTLPNDFTFVAGHRIGIVLGANFSGTARSTARPRRRSRSTRAEQDHPAGRRRLSGGVRVGCVRCRRHAARAPGAGDDHEGRNRADDAGDVRRDGHR